MGDKKSIAQSTIKKQIRPATVSAASSTSRKKVSVSTVKDKVPISRQKPAKIGEGDVTIVNKEGSTSDFDAELREVAYGKFFRSMLEECLIDEQIEREETQMDIQMAQLAERLQKTITQLDKTNRRVKEINFVVEQQRLQDLKTTDTDKLFNLMEKSKSEDLLNNLSATEQHCIDKLATKNVDFGYNPKCGHSQLLDAVNEAINGLECIKTHSKLDPDKFKEYAKSKQSLEELQKKRFDLNSVKTEFESRFPKFNELLVKEASNMITNVMEKDGNDDNNVDDDESSDDSD